MADYKKIIPFILKAEGGLSRATTDTASRYPVPDGSGYHTNKGVTWRTFEDSGKRFGYDPTPALFYAMPDGLWTLIWKKGYWDAIGGDQIRSQAIADLMADFAWASGPGTAVREMQKVLNALGANLVVDGIIGPKTLAAINTSNEKQLFESFAWQREFFIKKLNQPANERGWLNRLASLVDLKKKTSQPQQEELA